MARGQPDFGMYTSKEVLASISDMGELAARLGSLDIFDRRGDVFTLDDFEAPVLKWDYSGGAWGTAVNFDTIGARSGCQDILLTSDASTGSSATIYKGMQFRGSYRLGAEISVSNPNDYAQFVLHVYLTTGTELLRGKVKWDVTAKTLSYYDSDGNWVEFYAAADMPCGRYVYTTFKLVIDGELKKYVRLQFGHLEFDLSSYALYSEDSTLAPCFWVSLEVYTTADVAATIYLDDFIATINEP